MVEAMQNAVQVTAKSIMPADPNKLAITVRADPEQHEAWVAAARAGDRSLAKWIARACDAAAGYVPSGKPSRKPRKKQGR